MKKLLGIVVLGLLWSNVVAAQFLICEIKVREFTNGDIRKDVNEVYKLYRKDNQWCTEVALLWDKEKCNRLHDAQDNIEIPYITLDDEHRPNYIKSYNLVVNRFTGKFLATIRYKSENHLIQYDKGICTLQEKKQF